MDIYNHFDDIAKLSEQEARRLSYRSMDIKGHAVYFINFAGKLGQCALVYLGGAHLSYASCLQCSFCGRYEGDTFVPYTEAEREKKYISTLNQRLFTEKELGKRLSSYAEYCARKDYLRNHYSRQAECISVFDSGFYAKGDRRAEVAASEFRRKTQDMYFSAVSFSYYYDRAFVEKMDRLSQKLEKVFSARKNDYRFWKGAFTYEMYNHEFTYAESDWEVLSVFGSIDGRQSLESWLESLGFSDAQKKAYRDARAKVLASA